MVFKCPSTPARPVRNGRKKGRKYRKYECNLDNIQTENPQSCPINLLEEKLAEKMVHTLISTPASLAAAKNDLIEIPDILLPRHLSNCLSHSAGSYPE